MDVKQLFSNNYQIIAVMDNDDCPAADFMANGEASTRASREGLSLMLSLIAENGLNGIPAACVHEADKKNGIYEFIKGPLRLFFFKGAGRQIVVCTVGTRKKGQKADKPSVNKSIEFKNKYFDALKKNMLKVTK